MLWCMSRSNLLVITSEHGGSSQMCFVLSVQEPFWQRINNVRNKELGILWKSFIIDATNACGSDSLCTETAVHLACFPFTRFAAPVPNSLPHV